MECNSFYQHDEMDKEYNSFYQDDEAVKEREAIDGSYESWLVYVYIDGVKTQLSAPKKTELEAKLASLASKSLYNKDNLNKELGLIIENINSITNNIVKNEDSLNKINLRYMEDKERFLEIKASATNVKK